jgi:glycosyltransferase involved in cell wall biosynthesis
MIAMNGKKKRIAIWTEGGWALGKIYEGLKDSLQFKYDVDFYNWHDNNANKKLWIDGAWRDYDIIMGNTAVTFWPEDYGFFKKMPKELIDKMIIGIWANLNLDNNHFKESIRYTEGPTFHCLTPEIQESAKLMYNIDATIAKPGTSTSEFFPFKKVDKIEVIGLNGDPRIGGEWSKIKRPDMLVDIAQKSNCQHSFIFNSSEHGCMIYKDIDMYVCTSTSESGPAGIMECAMSKIPVISTKVGYAKTLKSIKTFTTVDEAVDIINELNSSPVLLNNYVDELYNEVIKEYDWVTAAPKYWIPLIESVLNKS